MTRFSPSLQRSLRFAITGSGTLPLEIAMRLRSFSVSVDIWPSLPDDLTPYDAVLSTDMGVSTAFAEAMRVMGCGCSFFTCNPLVVMAHGTVLQRAAQGQGVLLGLSAAGFGSLSLADIAASYPLHRLVFSSGGGINAVLARMAFRAEPFDLAERHVANHSPEARSDLSGKTTLARALTMYAQLTGDMAPAVYRASLDLLEPQTLATLRGWGAMVRYGVVMTATGLSAGPLAIADGHPLSLSFEQDVLVAETSTGDVVTSQSSETTSRILAGFAADVRRFMLSRRENTPCGFSSVPEASLVVVAGDEAALDSALSKSLVLARARGVALVRGAYVASAPLLTMPFAGEFFQPESLRLVG